MLLLFAGSTVLLAVGGALWLLGSDGAADALWLIGTAAGLAVALTSTARALRRRRPT